MNRPTNSWLAGLLATLITLAGAAVGRGQSSSGSESGPLAPSSPVVAPSRSPADMPFAELEARVAELENALRREQGPPASNAIRTAQLPQPPAPRPGEGRGDQDDPIRDPAIRTVDEQTRPAEDNDDAGELIRRWIGRIQDPAITTVAEQTRSATALGTGLTG